jgi:hypothetical protein
MGPSYLACTFIAALLAMAPMGCISSVPQPIDDQRMAEQMAAGDMQMRQYQQQPRSTRQSKKLIRPQPVENPLHADRDLEQ